MRRVKFRVFDVGIPKSALRPIIDGRVPTRWLLENAHRISTEDFYNQELTEQDLKDKYGA